MARKLPARPNLDHLRRQAKALLASLNEGDEAAAREFKKNLPSAGVMTTAQILKAGLRLADAQSAIARKSGFESWPKLARHVSQLRELEGVWEFASLEIEGSAVPRAMLGSSRLVIDGDLFRTESPDAIYEGVFNIDVEVEPHHIDIEFVAGPEAGNWSYGIYELSRDSLTICLGLTGAKRPVRFATAPGSGHALETLVRRRSGALKLDPEKAVTPFEPSPPELLAPLSGSWRPESVILDGQALPAEMLKYGKRVVTGNHTLVTFGGPPILDGLTRVDTSKEPWEIDYLHAAGMQAGKIQRAIARVDLGRAEFCMAPAGEPRPTRFDGKKGTGWSLSVWRRAK
ncbi:MAG: TIGR03067 domain-containing protein [Acidobacteria bacterium]|nr:TIGR03067 domain-containing protein [Acidobacteriota bacterium]